MKRVILLGCCLWNCLNINAQIDIEKAKTIITKQMESFCTVLDYLNAEDEYERYDTEDANKMFGGDYLQYNNTEYNTLGKWLKNFYCAQLDNEILQHTIVVDEMSIKKESNNPKNKRYSFKAILTRETGEGKDFKMKDVPVSFSVVLEDNNGIAIQEIKGDWKVKVVRPSYEWKYYLEVPNYHNEVAADGEKRQFSVRSWAQQMKVYEGIQTIPTERSVNVPVVVEGEKVDAEIKDNTVSVNFRYNYSREPRYYNVTVKQKKVGEEMINDGMVKKVTFTQLGQPKESWWKCLTQFDEYDAPDMDVKFHYGLDNTTFGLGATYRFDDTRFTLGFYGAMSKYRISLIDWTITKVYEQNTTIVIPGTTTNFGTTVIIDKNGNSVQVEKYTEKVIDVIKPTKRGYSQTMDPDGEAVHKKAYSYVMAMPGFYMNDWVHFDLGLGVARTQDTYRMEDAYQINVIEKSYVKDGVSETVTENKYVRTGDSFLYKDAAKFHFAVRPGLNLQIPVSSDEHYLKFGVGYTFVPSDKDANNLDLSVGFAFQF